MIFTGWHEDFEIYASLIFRWDLMEKNRKPRVSFFGQWSKMQLISLQNFIIKTCFIQFLWFFRLKCWLKGQIISRIHLSLPNEYKLICFERNINGNRDDKFLEWYYWPLHWPKKLTLGSKDSVKKTPIKQLIYNGLMKKLSSTVGLGLLKRTLQTSFGPTWKVLYLFFRETLMW